MGKRNKGSKNQTIDESYTTATSTGLENIKTSNSSKEEKQYDNKISNSKDEMTHPLKKKRKPDVILMQNNPNVTHKKQKKIIFEENGEPQEVNSSLINNSINKKNNSLIGNEEDNVKDEEIDEFCEDIGEEDNKQYESWIELLEKKLGNSTEPVKKKNKRKAKQ